MPAPAESLTNAFEEIQENHKAQIVMHKRLFEISEEQLKASNEMVKEMEKVSGLQNELIDNLTQSNECLTLMVQERDAFIKSLNIA